MSRMWMNVSILALLLTVVGGCTREGKDDVQQRGGIDESISQGTTQRTEGLYPSESNSELMKRNDTDRTGLPADLSRGGLELRIREFLSDDRSIADQLDRIQIVESNGEVTLSGTVDSDDDKEFIEQKVKSVAGVTSVNNLLTVMGEEDQREE